MANAAADVDELTGGRMIVGQSKAPRCGPTSTAPTSAILPRLREYVEILRAHWKHFSDGEPFSFEGRFYRAASPPVNPWGVGGWSGRRSPCTSAWFSRGCFSSRARSASGVLTWLSTPTYVEEVTSNLAVGAERAGRIRRRWTSPHSSSAASPRIERRRCAERGSTSAATSAFRGRSNGPVRGRRRGARRPDQAYLEQGPIAFDSLPEHAVKKLAICGTPEEGRDQLAAYDGLLSHPVLHTPYVPPLEQADSEDCFRQTVAAFAPQTVST